MRDSLPNASFIGFTGTPIEKADANTRAVFGDYISIYDIQRAVLDKATVPIYYESRLAKLELKPSERPKLDPEFEEAMEGEEVERKEKLKTRWAQLEAVVGRAGQGRGGGAQNGRGTGPCHPPDHFQGYGVRRGRGYFCCRRPQEAGHLDTLG
jgi:type I restriction enzyme R subunit